MGTGELNSEDYTRTANNGNVIFGPLNRSFVIYIKNIHLII